MSKPQMFHIEISAGLRHARIFNLTRDDLVAKVIQPWLEDRTIEAGEREWRPRDSSLKVLEGPRMENADLSFGQGWANAERASENVTGELLATAPAPSAPDAFVIETDSPEALLAEVVGFRGRPLHWADARKKIDGRDPEVAAVILVLKKTDA